MVKKMVYRSLMIIIPGILFCGLAFTKEEADVLYPPMVAYQTGYLKVSAIHEIFYQLGGNPHGKPVMVIHGGPGAGCSSHDFRYFDPQKYLIILHDQRGAGQSRPYADLRENTTAHLVADIEALRQFLKVDKVILFGGSWGTTLALAYAEAFPQHVSGMILRGVFTATKQEIDHFYHGGTASYFPENFEHLAQQIDHPEQKNYPVQLLAKMQSQDSVVRQEAARAWARYEAKIAFLNLPDQRLDQMLTQWPFFAFSLIENHYMAHGCFLEEGQLLAQAEKLKEIPAIIINGRYDIICPPITAFRLHQKWPGSKLWIIEEAGHASSEPGIEAALVLAARKFE
ncbi:MAG: prolyl aminopeptidase [candidate division KSB1 bacterium]|nr:prolyl aminopeptidase [candidate division KSB1 bacterium]MDZ7319807.1 prolyl aminopeptidase [candidate division KSB1 bacterium]MDZ7340271.1 prolyl aminopeptidase [candidate division KSB1 bacterium]